MAEKDFEFSKRLERLIKEAGLNNKKVADAIGISAAAISGYINEGRVPEAPILLNISRLLRVSMEELLTGKEGIKPLIVSEPVATYNVRDAEIQEIVEFLRESPLDKKLILKMIKGRKMADEALESLKSKRLVEDL